MPEIGSCQVAVFQVGSREIGSRETRLRQITFAQIRLAEEGPFQSRPFQIGPGEFRVTQVRLTQIRALKLRILTVFEPLSVRFHDRLQLLGRNWFLFVRALTASGVPAYLTRLCCLGDGRYADGQHSDQHNVDGADSSVRSIHCVSP
jgi:hypothetical protein